MQISSFKSIIYYSFGLIVFLTGCAHYDAKPLDRLPKDKSSNAYESTCESNGIELACEAFSKEECKKFLDRDVITEGFQPIHITIYNNSNKELIFSTSEISLPCAAPEEVEREAETSTVDRVAAYGVGSLFIRPLIIPAVVDSVKSSQSNTKLDKDFFHKSIQQQNILPGATLNGLLFIPNDSFQKDLIITLVDANSRKKIVLKGKVRKH